MALPKRDIEIKTVTNVQDSLGQARSNDGNMVELQHVSGGSCNGGRLWHAIWLPADGALGKRAAACDELANGSQ